MDHLYGAEVDERDGKTDREHPTEVGGD